MRMTPVAPGCCFSRVLALATDVLWCMCSRASTDPCATTSSAVKLQCQPGSLLTCCTGFAGRACC
jgi:hypothetical protein